MCNGYFILSVSKFAQKGQKTYLVHPFVWECFNAIIPAGIEVGHIHNNKNDNRLCNLQLANHQQICKKATKNHGCSNKTEKSKNKRI